MLSLVENGDQGHPPMATTGTTSVTLSNGSIRQGGSDHPPHGVQDLQNGAWGVTPEAEKPVKGVAEVAQISVKAPVPLTRSMWVDEPPFAAGLRQLRDDRMIEARIAAGAVKQRHAKPSKQEPSPTYDLVGGSLSPEALRALDFQAVVDLQAMWSACQAEGFERDAAWCAQGLASWSAIFGPYFEGLAAELLVLRDRILKADAIAAGPGWPDAEKRTAAETAAAKVWARFGHVFNDLDTYRPDLIPADLWPKEPAALAEASPVHGHLVKVGGYVRLLARFGEAIARDLYASHIGWLTATPQDRAGWQEKYKTTWAAALAGEHGRASA